MTKIFICYRRQDSQYVTDSIHDHMIGHFGADDVFLDVGSIPLGVDFRNYLAEQISEHDVVLVVIGPDWAKIMKERKDHQDDFVRIEIETALGQNKIVIPVLVMETAMPDFRGLPDSISDLQWRNSITIRRKPYLENDCNRLAEGIRQAVETKHLKASQQGVSVSDQSSEPILLKSLQSPTADKVCSIIGEPFDWCKVPAGEFLYGQWNKKLFLPEYMIAKYPITFSQFQVFVEADDGLRDGRWWEELFKSQHDQSWPVSNHPRENVTWYAALAFCRWLSFRLGGDYVLNHVENWLIRLPTGLEWEKAARGANGLIYPWGDRFDKTLCNTRASGIGKTTPVDAFMDAASPYGVVDMIGNVKEWCLNKSEQPERDVTQQDLRAGGNRVFRGSPFEYDPARADAQGAMSAETFGKSIGFRISAPASR